LFKTILVAGGPSPLPDTLNVLCAKVSVLWIPGPTGDIRLRNLQLLNKPFSKMRHIARVPPLPYTLHSEDSGGAVHFSVPSFLVRRFVPVRLIHRLRQLHQFKMSRWSKLVTSGVITGNWHSTCEFDNASNWNDWH
jgi:hypothetical protein